jgi:exodeoxyribonuclease V gamma subunit
MREIQALHDNLLAMFDEDPHLRPKDIVVMAPDIAVYAPYIQAVFATQPNERLRIPYSIADDPDSAPPG